MLDFRFQILRLNGASVRVALRAKVFALPARRHISVKRPKWGDSNRKLNSHFSGKIEIIGQQ